jgi:hypothetical protein
MYVWLSSSLPLHVELDAGKGHGTTASAKGRLKVKSSEVESSQVEGEKAPGQRQAKRSSGVRRKPGETPSSISGVKKKEEKHPSSRAPDRDHSQTTEAHTTGAGAGAGAKEPEPEPEPE